MTSRIVVAGVSSLAMHLDVGEFPIRYAPVSEPRWVTSGTGGAGAQVATVLRALDNDVRLCTMVGHDPAGELVRRHLRAHGLEGPGVVDVPVSSQCAVLVAGDGRRIVYPHLSVVNAVEYPTDRFVEAARDADLAVLTTAEFVRNLLPAAVLRGVPIAVDLNLIADVTSEYHQPWLEVADIVFCSHERLPCPPARWIAQVMGRYPGAAIAAVGCGPAGSVIGLRDGRMVSVAAVAPLGVRNTSSAGDSLFAAFVHSWLATGNPVEALSDAVVFAGWRIGHRDPTSVVLAGSELASLRLRHPVRVSLGWWNEAE